MLSYSYTKVCGGDDAMQVRKLLIAESSEEFRTALAEAFSGMYHVRTCVDGKEAWDLICDFMPDVMILNLMLPEIDGLSLLQQMRDGLERMPVILAVSRFLNDYTLEALARMDVGYAVPKPCRVSAVVERLRDMDREDRAEPVAKADPRSVITNIMMSLGFKTTHDGYKYLREAALMVCQHPDQAITKELYPAVGAMFGRSPGNVERSCRTAIEAAVERGSRESWLLYFTPDGNGELLKPSNGTFITRMAEVLRAHQRSGL